MNDILRIEKELNRLKRTTCCASNLKLKEQPDVIYTLIKSDNNSLLKTTSNLAVTVNIPLDSTVNFPIGSTIVFEQWGSGQITFVPAVGVTMNSSGGANKTTSQYVSAYLRKDAINTWILIGNITV